MPKGYTYRKTSTQWLWGDWEGLEGLRLKQRLLERMASSAEGQRKFWSRVKKGKPNECWEWTGFLDHRDYGRFVFYYSAKRCQRIFVHRISYFLKHGKLPHHLGVCHHCDNTRCVNPKHLFLGTVPDNTYDMINKDRHARGNRHGMRKLSEKDVTRIRFLRFRKRMGYDELAKIYKVTPTALCFAAMGRTWKNVPFEKGIEPTSFRYHK